MEYRLIKKYDKRFITVPRLEELGLKNCFTSKDMDLGMKTNKSIENIQVNFNLAYKFMDINPRESFYGMQIHSNNIVLVREGIECQESDIGKFFPDTDGLISGEKGIALNTKYADCIPIIIFDPIKMVHANIHSGWKGTLGKIGPKGLEIMIKEYNSKPEDIIIVLGPAIDKNDFEVGKDVMIKFKETFDFSQEIIQQKNDDKYLINLKGIVKRLFIDLGVKSENIIDINLSTYSTSYLHSYRRDKEDFGLMSCITSL